MERLSGVRTLVSQLYESLNVEEHQLIKERELLSKMEELRVKLEPLEKVRFCYLLFIYIPIVRKPFGAGRTGRRRQRDTRAKTGIFKT